MEKYNINIEHKNLDDLIKKIKFDLNNISELFKKNSNILEKLDNNWIGPDKEKCDSEYFPYIENINQVFLENMNNCLNLLEKANITYQDTNINIKNDIENL